MTKGLKIVVIGAGAVGGWAGGRLALGGHVVTLVGREWLAEAVSGRGLHLRAPGNTASDVVVSDLAVVNSIADAASKGPFDLALLTVKTFDVDTAIVEMMAVEQGPSEPDGMRQTTGWGRPVIVALQNGVQSEEALADAFGPERVVSGTLLNPISIPQPGTAMLEKWRGGIGLAPVKPGALAKRWVRVFDEAVLPTRAYSDWRAMKWSKLLLNLVGNASAAILDMSSRELYADPRLVNLEVEMLREGLVVMRRLGLKAAHLPGYPVPFLAWGVRWAPLFLQRPILRALVARGRGGKPPSLLLELKKGRHQSEISHLNGAVVLSAERLGIATPVNRTLTEILTRLVDRRLEWNGIRHRPSVLLAVATEMKRKEK